MWEERFSFQFITAHLLESEYPVNAHTLPRCESKDVSSRTSDTAEAMNIRLICVCKRSWCMAWNYPDKWLMSRDRFINRRYRISKGDTLHTKQKERELPPVRVNEWITNRQLNNLTEWHANWLPYSSSVRCNWSEQFGNEQTKRYVCYRRVLTGYQLLASAFVD